MKTQRYINRIADDMLSAALARAGGVLIEGPKGCGKTETARQQAESSVQVDIDPDVNVAMEVEPLLVLEGDTPRLLDEWQVHPMIWDVARHEVDRRQEVGQFILTGSTAPAEAAQRHSGAGRFARLTMHTMTLWESGESTGNVSLASVSRGEPVKASATDITLELLADRICRGGWPGFLSLSTADAQANLRDYIRTITELDINTPDNTRRDPIRVGKVLQSLARGVGTETSVTSIATDAELNRETVMDYLDSLQRIFISQDQPAWAQSLRSRSPLRKAPKRHLADPALAVAALQKTPADLVRDLEYFGQIFESFVVHELRALSNEPVFHARLASGEEVDAMVRIAGKLLLVEVKLGRHRNVIDSAADNLVRFSKHLDEPVECLVITGGGMSYKRQDGVYVAAVNALRQ